MGQADEVGLGSLSSALSAFDVIPLLPMALTGTAWSEGETLIISGDGTRDLEGEGDSGALYLAERLSGERNDTELWGGRVAPER